MRKNKHIIIISLCVIILLGISGSLAFYHLEKATRESATSGLKDESVVQRVISTQRATSPQEKTSIMPKEEQPAEEPIMAQPVTPKNDQVTYLDDAFTLPDPHENRPVYDRYTIRQRQEKGLPLTYGAKRDYYYGKKVVYLTFDDGPDKQNTPAILRILKQENIKGTFFLVGLNVVKHPSIVRAIFESGNAIGLHSYTHNYKKLYASPQNYMDEMMMTEDVIYRILQVRPIITRAPGGTAGHFTKAYWDTIKRYGYIEVGWNSLTGDADGTGKMADKAYQNIVSQIQQQPYLHTHLVILMHDSAGHGETVTVLPRIIHYFKEQGYTFRVITPAIPPAW
ncbi:polysaccharide deacetylase family protein [uncultured Megasphaera sp.]|uniref:polysaccharide deacetylase family protein n=1 Tax=uncultured Megasphaera sp. TaxID=165188 RepID=UPI002597C9B9|nr:polysaccharide deacetylase family protein [uncultured Megasphaera sp.]